MYDGYDTFSLPTQLVIQTVQCDKLNRRMLTSLHNKKNCTEVNTIRNAEDSPPNVKKENIIEALNDLSLHFIDRCRTPCHTEAELCCPPVLLNKIELAMIFWIKVAQMAVRLNQLLKLGLLWHEIRLCKENALAAAVGATCGAAKTWILSKKIPLTRPQTTLPNDNLHALKSARHGGVVFREIKGMRLAVWKCTAMHKWTIRVVRPSFLGCCERSQLLYCRWEMRCTFYHALGWYGVRCTLFVAWYIVE